MHENDSLSEYNKTKAYLRGGVQGVQTPPPPPEIFRFFLKSDGKEVERKKKKNEKGWGGGLTYFWGLRFFGVGFRYFQGGGLRNFRGG